MKTYPEPKPVISIIILNYNSGDYLLKCIESLYQSNLAKTEFEIIVVDNNSTDNSLKLIEKIPPTHLLKLKNNLGFAHGNNQGVKLINKNSQYVFFLNPDTILDKSALNRVIETFKKNSQIAAISPYVILAKNNQLQPECHRGYPYPSRSLLHFLKISDRGYFQTSLDTNKAHRIEAGVGAAIILRKEIGNKIGWWDEDYFMYGEDLQLSWDINKFGYQLWFIPEIKVVHYQGISSGIKSNTENKKIINTSVAYETRKRSILATTQAMRLFHQKNLKKKYPYLVNQLIFLGINILEKIRLLSL